MTHGSLIRKCSPAATSMAPAWRTLWCLPTTNPWIWVVRPPVIKATTAICVVLLHGLSGLLVTLSEGEHGHG